MEISRENLFTQILQKESVKNNINKLVHDFETGDNIETTSNILVQDIFTNITEILDKFLKDHGMRGFKISIPDNSESVVISIVNIHKEKITIDVIIDFLEKNMPITFDLVYHGRILVSIKNIDFDNNIDSTIYNIRSFDEGKALRAFIRNFITN